MNKPLTVNGNSICNRQESFTSSSLFGRGVLLVFNAFYADYVLDEKMLEGIVYPKMLFKSYI